MLYSESDKIVQMGRRYVLSSTRILGRHRAYWCGLSHGETKTLNVNLPSNYHLDRIRGP